MDVDEEFVDKGHLMRWLTTAGKRCGVGAWRPEKSGEHGIFTVVSIRVKKK